MSRRRVLQVLLLGALLGLHLFTRLHAQQVTPLAERHFYSASYYVSLSLLHGSGFRYLMPSASVVGRRSRVPDGWQAIPPVGDPRFPVIGFVQLAGLERVSARQFEDYVAAGVRPVEVDPIETTRILDIHLTALLWQAFGIGWEVYFVFYALLSTAANLSVFFIARRLTGSYWCGLAAAAGFLASPLELYAGAWSTRDTAPLWFACLAFGTLAWFLRRRRTGCRALAASFALGFVSLLGLGWRADAQLLPPFVFGALLLMLGIDRWPWRAVAMTILGFMVGCSCVLLILRSLGPGHYSQGGTVFHTAWYGEAPRSNLLRTENAFQVARDDYLTLYQANYFARGVHGATREGTANVDTKSLQHYRRCREMYLALARYSAHAWWSAFPSFLARSLRTDRTLLLGSETEAANFRARRPAWLEPARRLVLDRYGGLLHWLFGLGIAGGLICDRTRWMTVVLGAFLVYYAAATLLVLPEPKHMAPLLLPLHVIGAAGLWFGVHAFRSWRRLPETVRAARGHLAVVAAIVAAILLAWTATGIASVWLSRRERARLVDAVLAASREGAADLPLTRDAKLIPLRPTPGATAPEAYLFKVRAVRPAGILSIHVREATAEQHALTYYTRHSIAPGKDRWFFINLVTGDDVGDRRPYTAYVRTFGPLRVVTLRHLDLSRWPLGLPLSFVFDDNDTRAGASFLDPPGASTEMLPASEVGHLLAEPRAFLRSYRGD